MNINQKGFANILLVIAIVVFIAGGIGYWTWSQKSSGAVAASKLPGTQQNLLNAEWNTYTSSQYGFSVQYPDTLEDRSDRSNFLVGIDTNYAIQHKRGGSVGVISPSRDPTSVANCLVVPTDISETHEVSDIGKTTINGVSFFSFTAHKSLRDSFYQFRSYRAVHGNYCYIINRLTSGKKNAESEADLARMSLELDGVVQTFRFTSP